MLPNPSDFKILELYLDNAPAEIKAAHGRIVSFTTGLIETTDVIPLLLLQHAENGSPLKMKMLIDQLPESMDWFGLGMMSLVNNGRWENIKELIRQWRSMSRLNKMTFNTKCHACSHVYDPDEPVYECPMCRAVRNIVNIYDVELTDETRMSLGATVDMGTAVRFMKEQFKTRDKDAVLDLLPRFVEMGSKQFNNIWQGKWLTQAVEFVLSVDDWPSFVTLIDDYRLATHTNERLKICGGRLGHCTECGYKYSGLYLDDWLCPDCNSVRRLCNRQDLLDNGRCPTHNGRVNSIKQETQLYTFRDGRLADIYQQTLAHGQLRDLGEQMALMVTRVKDLHDQQEQIDLVALSAEINRRLKNLNKVIGKIKHQITTGQVQPALDNLDGIITAIELIKKGAEAGVDESSRWDEIRQSLELYRKFRETEHKISTDEKKTITFNYLVNSLFMFTELAVQRMKPLLPEPDVDNVKALLLRDVEKIIDGEVQ